MGGGKNSDHRGAGRLAHVVPLCERESRPVLRPQPRRTPGPAGPRSAAPVTRGAGPVLPHPSRTAAPVVPVPPPSADSLPWKTVDVSKDRFLGLMTGTPFDHDAWSKAVKEFNAANAGKGFTPGSETHLNAPPVFSKSYSNQNAQAKEWATARSYELKWQAFEQAARSGTMPPYKEGNIGPRLDQAFAKNGGYFKTADQIRVGFLGPGAKLVKPPDSLPATDIRWVSADGKREFRQIFEQGETRMEYLTIGRDSVSAVRLHL